LNLLIILTFFIQGLKRIVDPETLLINEWHYFVLLKKPLLTYFGQEGALSFV